MYIKDKETCPIYISKTHSNCEKQIILSMIPNKEKEEWHYLLIKKLALLLHGITSKHKGDFYCFVLLEQKINLNLLKKYVKTQISVKLYVIRKG